MKLLRGRREEPGPWERGYTLVPFINPRRACAARVTVVVLSFRLSGRPSVCPLPRFHTGFIFKMAFFCKNAVFESYGVKQSEEANMQISAGLPRPALRTLEAPEVATQGEYRLPPAI